MEDVNSMQAIKEFMSVTGKPVTTAELLTLKKADNANGTDNFGWFAEECAKALGKNLVRPGK